MHSSNMRGGDRARMRVVLYAATVVLTELIPSNATGVLMFPIAMAVAHNARASYLPYVVAVMIGASCGFITPIGYQSNLMVYGPGATASAISSVSARRSACWWARQR
jgi:di/tricarboxylate transporter